MQFTTQTQQAIICPQCDNVVPIDAEFCNICGKRLRPPLANTRTAMPIASYPPPAFTSQIEDAEDDDEYIDEDEDESEQHGKGIAIPATPAELLYLLRQLQEQAVHIGRYFPPDLAVKAQQTTVCKQQVQRALAITELFERPQ